MARLESAGGVQHPGWPLTHDVVDRSRVSGADPRRGDRQLDTGTHVRQTGDVYPGENVMEANRPAARWCRPTEMPEPCGGWLAADGRYWPCPDLEHATTAIEIVRRSLWGRPPVTGPGVATAVEQVRAINGSDDVRVSLPGRPTPIAGRGAHRRAWMTPRLPSVRHDGSSRSICAATPASMPTATSDLRVRSATTGNGK
jgi:hypothetical protein